MSGLYMFGVPLFVVYVSLYVTDVSCISYAVDIQCILFLLPCTDYRHISNREWSRSDGMSMSGCYRLCLK